jgi:hypothetical protein
MEHVSDRLAPSGLKGVRVEALAVENLNQLREYVKRERTASPVLGCPHIEPNDAGNEVHPVPGEWEHFRRHTPASELGERHDAAQRLR